ncbi:MAG TPA: glycosyltransferase family 39 protein, partial [Anaerolineales bacterium]|nr:glycosyltransferase family 39 protein [Anaerolineales bacterium]
MSSETPNPNQYPLGEPSVLDYVKSLFRFRDGERIQIPDFVEEEKQLAVSFQPSASDSVVEDVLPETISETALHHSSFDIHPSSSPFPWRSLLAFVLALIGQRLFEPPPTSYPLGYAFYLGALGMLVWAIWRGEWTLPALAESSEGNDPQTYRLIGLIASIALAIWSFFIFRDNYFTTGRVAIWLLAIAVFFWAFWINRTNLHGSLGQSAAFFQREAWTINISRWTLLLLAATALVFFFRFYQTASVPPEPFSDHAEKIMDVFEVSQGQTHIFFVRNTGREALQMYWTLLVAKIFGTGFSFLSLKLGTAILGFLTLPFIYLLGKEIGGPRVGLFAFIMAGIGYWPNVISRVGLRFPLYPLFVAPTLFFLLRGLRTRNRNDFLLSGLFLGIGLHGYSPFRIVPIVVVAAFILYWLHGQSKGAQKDSAIWLTLLALASLFVFVPLLSFWAGHPAEFGFRAMSRLSGLESPITQPIWQIF